MLPLSTDERLRYQRHLDLPGFGEDAQRALKASSVLLVGAGGLGAPVGLYLAAAGVGRIGLVDFDRVEASNLQRQVHFTTADVGALKAEAAAARLRALNPHIQVDVHVTRLDSTNARDLIRPYDVVADGTDNFPTRYLVNDACVLEGKPNAHASIFRFEGQVSVFGASGGPCYRCLYEHPPPPETVPSCADGGVLGVLPGLAGTLQATEVIKLLTGVGPPLIGRLLLFDALTSTFRTLRVPRNPDCPVCGDAPTQHDLIDYDLFCNGPALPAVTPADLAALPADTLLLDVREPEEYATDNLGGLLIPLGELSARLAELSSHQARPIVVHCQQGGRSARAVRLLQAHGFSDVKNLEGGLAAVRSTMKHT